MLTIFLIRTLFLANQNLVTVNFLLFYSEEVLLHKQLICYACFCVRRGRCPQCSNISETDRPFKGNFQGASLGKGNRQSVCIWSRSHDQQCSLQKQSYKRGHLIFCFLDQKVNYTTDKTLIKIDKLILN